ncbi:MAG: zinc ribbon domain-containing protein [Lachnospiraceae bacterium]|nr:zinc ribbon domain-containing protein [Lachnospiraceae bacterium]
MYCNECNYQLSDGAKFCPICGAKTPYYVNNEDVQENPDIKVASNKIIQEKIAFKKLQYKREMYDDYYFKSKEQIIQYANYALIFAMTCVCVKFAIDLYYVIALYADGYVNEFKISHFEFVFDFIKNISILYALRVIVYEVYFTLKNMLINVKNDIFIKMEDDKQYK